MDTTTFRQFFAPALRRRPLPALPATTVEGIADQVSEVRLFLTDNPNVVLGEIAVTGKTGLTEITIPLEKESVKFVDTGQTPDKRRGDGVFTATFPMSTDTVWQSRRRALGASAQALGPGGARQFVRRGPRDIVPVKDAMEALRTQSPTAFKALVENAPRLRQMAEARTPQEAARTARVDVTRTPFLTLPGPRFDPRDAFRFERAFDIPVLDIVPFPPLPVPIDEFKSLMIIDPGVVEDGTRSFDPCTGTGTAGGPWSFGHLMRELSHGTNMTPEDFTLHWLSNWILLQEANGFLVNEPGRALALQNRVINSWQQLSGAGAPLNVDRFPARLLAIVNRPDLADKIGYGSAGSAGEGRFVFGLLEKTAGAPGCTNLEFTVIFEYGIKGGSCTAVKAWHQRWKNLDTHALGSSAYNAALELITRDFTDHGSNPGQLPNQSSINQLRTNEIALGFPWQLREFRLQSAGAVAPGIFDLVTVKQTPADGFNNTATLSAYIVANEVEIFEDRHVVPERFPGIFNRFMGAISNVPSPGFFWNAPGLAVPPLTKDPAEVRRKFSLATCNACHGGETNTFFTHIGSAGTRAPGAAAALSGFLTGIDVTVPVSGNIHRYQDLVEREKAMSNILSQSCFALLGVRRIPFVH